MWFHLFQAYLSLFVAVVLELSNEQAIWVPMIGLKKILMGIFHYFWHLRVKKKEI